MNGRCRSERKMTASRRKKRRLASAILASAAVLLPVSGRAGNPAEVLELPQVQIVGTTLLPGSGVDLRKLPANVQIFTSKDLHQQSAASAADFLNQNATGIGINAAQGNSYQPDVNVRGFTASPVLGTPQGISVFLDGMRVNEPFGDSVNWDLIAQSAISSIQLIPGSNPAFGLNTLGGAIAIYTKSGSSEYPEHPGGSITVSGGSFGRRTLGFEAGGKADTWDWFVTSNDSTDKGWAEHNPSHVRQLFGKVGWQDDKTDLDFTLQWADNRLEGTQTLPTSFSRIREAYTWPDVTTNGVLTLALKGSTILSDGWLLSGNAYVRKFHSRNLSSNVNDAPGAGGAVQATNDVATIEQTGRGAALQLTHTGKLAGLGNQLSFGASIDHGRARFSRSSQDATFTANRGTEALGDFVAQTDSDSTARFVGAFVSDSLSLDERWTLSLAGRLNIADVAITDRSGVAPELNGAHRFERFNPALGLSFNPSASLTAYASYNEGMRAPTAIELACADPDAPCKLPNNFLADPPLKKVMSRTKELGARGTLQGGGFWSVAVFRTDLYDDLQFISSNGVAVNAGYFQNVGTTRRQGLELGASTKAGPLGLSLHYGLIDATYRTGFIANSPSNSTADANGAITVKPGDRIPSLPRQSLKLRVDAHASAEWTLGLNLLAASGVYARGDENNLDTNGRIGGYSVVAIDTHLRLTSRVSLFGRIDNLLDRRYANFGILGENVFAGPGGGFDRANARSEQFRGYGAPRGVWVGLQYTFL